MPLYKGKNIKEKRVIPGCMAKWYPIQPENDLLDWLVVRRSLDMDDKWEAQLHSHPNYEEYWFVIDGRGQMICGDETYDVEVGDLLITPRGVPHKVRGDITFICCAAKHNVYGQTLGTKSQYIAHNRPYRDNPDDLPEVGKYIEEDVTLNYYNTMGGAESGVKS